MNSLLAIAALCLSAVLSPCGASTIAPPADTDADTREWWKMTAALADDDMEGRDTGSAGYDRAAQYVIRKFKAAGLQPAGDTGGWLQRVPLTEVRVEPEGTSVDVVRDDSSSIHFEFLHELTVHPTETLPARIDAPLAFRGYCSSNELETDMKGKVAVCFGTRRQGLPSAAERVRAAAQAGALAIISVDDPGFALEPARWPAAYARSVRIEGDPPVPASDIAVFNLSSAAFLRLVSGLANRGPEVLQAGATQQPLPAFEIPGRFSARLRLARRRYSSDNVLALLPGTDRRLKQEVLVVSAHLDGYGYGTAVDGDTLYNGAFDDAAYVSTLIRLAERRQGKGFRRGVLFAAFTGEEKGLLGSAWFVRHPTVTRDRLIADINLDMIRPLFPLKALTMLAMTDSSLGALATSLGESMHIQIRPDKEPERGLLQRADHWSFLNAGVPATTFVFAYDPNTLAERRYREWYNTRYHRPQDDMSQPIDLVAAAEFNRFFYALTAAVADGYSKPVFLPGSPFAAVP